MINVLFNTQDEEDWIRISPTGKNKIYNCNFFFKEEDIPKLTPTQQRDILTDLCRLLGLLDSESELEAPESASLSKDGNRLNVAGRGDFLRLTATMMALHHYIDIEDPEQGNFTPEHYGSYDLDDEIESGREMVRLLRNDLKGNLPRNLERQAITASSDFGLWLAATEDKTSGRDSSDVPHLRI